MNREQKERLTAWCLNLLVTYRIDFFRGLVLSDTVNFFNTEDPDRIEVAIESCRGADSLGFVPDQKDYTELLRELREIAKEVPLSDTAQTAITHVFGGNGRRLSKPSTSSRANATNRTNYQNEKKMKYIVKNRLTGAICGEFETYGQAGKWVEEYTHEQNKGISPDAPEYCSPFDFLLLSK